MEESDSAKRGFDRDIIQHEQVTNIPNKDEYPNGRFCTMFLLITESSVLWGELSDSAYVQVLSVNIISFSRFLVAM